MCALKNDYFPPRHWDDVGAFSNRQRLGVPENGLPLPITRNEGASKAITSDGTNTYYTRVAAYPQERKVNYYK